MYQSEGTVGSQCNGSQYDIFGAEQLILLHRKYVGLNNSMISRLTKRIVFAGSYCNMFVKMSFGTKKMDENGSARSCEGEKTNSSALVQDDRLVATAFQGRRGLVASALQG